MAFDRKKGLISFVESNCGANVTLTSIQRKTGKSKLKFKSCPQLYCFESECWHIDTLTLDPLNLLAQLLSIQLNCLTLKNCSTQVAMNWLPFFSLKRLNIYRRVIFTWLHWYVLNKGLLNLLTCICIYFLSTNGNWFHWSKGDLFMHFFQTQKRILLHPFNFVLMS